MHENTFGENRWNVDKIIQRGITFNCKTPNLTAAGSIDGKDNDDDDDDE